jgi:hypothetical protein
VVLYFHYPNTPSWRGVQLKKRRDKFTFSVVTKYLSFAAFSNNLLATRIFMSWYFPAFW